MSPSNGRKREPLGLEPGKSHPRLYDRLVEVFAARHCGRGTRKAYTYWIRRYLSFYEGRHPKEMDEDELNAFLTHLATEGRVAPATQNQALHAVLFLYEHVLNKPLDRVEGVVRAKRPKREPDVLHRGEVAEVLAHLRGVHRLVCMLLYGSGLRLSEALALRIKDLDFARRELVVRDGKGARDRVTMLPQLLHQPLRRQLREVRKQHLKDLGRGLGRVPLPTALARKFPNADREVAWQWVFPASGHFTDTKTGVRYRHHLHPSAVQKAIARARRASGITKRVHAHAFRHSFATQLLQDGYDIRIVQELLGHEDVRTTMVYTHVLNRGGLGVWSPLDGLGPTPPPTPRRPRQASGGHLEDLPFER